ncbi:MAG: NADH-quinone oxidoreductase subunit D [Chloroflexaceae bacterium]|nr:NADH-quinone oxidoreductase subunit D [Chloroflexaceae bacterium]NJO07541.1 NADH-quinone oxidoreductase subunit D [Chloroflexaceae bacterium]
MNYTLALGPFTPYWRGPQRLVLTIDGERVADVTYRAGYNERGITERLPRLRLEAALHLVARFSGTSSHAHTLAFCQALEALMAIDVPERAAVLRCVGAELERCAAHLYTLTDLFELLGRQQTSDELRRLWEQVREAMRLLSGRPALLDLCLPGGVRCNIDDDTRRDLLALFGSTAQALYALSERTIAERVLLARTVNVGTLARSVAEQYGLRGPLARASGVAADVRHDAPYAAYASLEVDTVTQEGGDVHARLVVLLLEAFESLQIAERALQALPDGAWEGSLPPGLPDGEGSAAVESPRGLLRYTVRSDGQRLGAVTIDAPHQIDRLLARTLFVGALVDDIVLIALSTDACAADAEG